MHHQRYKGKGLVRDWQRDSYSRQLSFLEKSPLVTRIIIFVFLTKTRLGPDLQFCNSIYDNLNRLTSISYNTSGATGVAATNNVAYTYDTSQTSATNGLLLSITMTGPMATYTETFS